jgi:hypothetical protein
MSTMPTRTLAACAFIAFQLCTIGYARFVDTRYFAWAPFDAQNEYSIAVEIGGRALTPDEVRHRYRIQAADLESRSIAHIIGIVRYAEERYYADGARVTISYTVNGVRKPDWIRFEGSNGARR